jgi:hypothetical protein
MAKAWDAGGNNRRRRTGWERGVQGTGMRKFGSKVLMEERGIKLLLKMVVDQGRKKASLENMGRFVGWRKGGKDVGVVGPRAKKSDTLDAIEGIVIICKRRVKVTSKAAHGKVLKESPVFEAKLARRDVGSVVSSRGNCKARATRSLKWSEMDNTVCGHMECGKGVGGGA